MWQHTWQPKHGRLVMLRMHLLSIMWHLVLIVFLLLGGGLLGCSELAYKAGDLYGWNCRPEALTKDGRCVAAR